MKKTSNSTKHGIYAKDVLLPWESADEFREMLQALYDELRPEGILEKQAVNDIAIIYQKKNRLRVFELMGHRKTRMVQEFQASGLRNLDEFADGIQEKVEKDIKQRRGFGRGLAKVAELGKELKLLAEDKNEGMRASRARDLREQLEQLEPLLQSQAACVELLNKQQNPADVLNSDENLAVFAKSGRLEDSLDASLYKKLGLLERLQVQRGLNASREPKSIEQAKTVEQTVQTRAVTGVSREARTTDPTINIETKSQIDATALIEPRPTGKPQAAEESQGEEPAVDASEIPVAATMPPAATEPERLITIHPDGVMHGVPPFKRLI